MNEALILWAFMGLQNIATILSILLVISAVTVIFLLIISVGEDQNYFEEFKDYIPYKTLVLSVLLVVLVPSNEDLKMIIGGALVWNGIENANEIDGFKELPENLVNAANSFLKEVSK